ncbi:MAG: HYR domain-containing protein, partial [Chloroflexi bacterium]
MREGGVGVQGKVGAALAPVGFGLLAIALLGAAGANAVTDVTAPAITLPAATSTDATSLHGAFVSYIAVATDDIRPTSLSCAPASGAQLPVGQNTITCTSTDAAGHTTTGSFVVTVLGASEQLVLLRDRVLAMNLPRGVRQALLALIDAATKQIAKGHTDAACSQSGELNDLVKGLTGDAAELGRRVLAILAALDCVSSTAPPVLLGPRADVTTTTAPGLPTATVRFTGESSAVVCAPSSPATLGVGLTKATCTATNANGTTKTSFNVTVLDKEPPVLTMPADITVNAPSGSSTAVVTFAPTATDNVGIASTVCAPASGSAFAHGPTTVSCTATDTSGNTATGTFKVTVNFAISGRITDHDTGLPLVGVRAAVFDSVTFERFDLTTSAGDGSYSIVVPSGSYRVRFNGNFAAPYFPQWWNGRADTEIGDVITVDGSMGSIDAALTRGFLIRGHVARQDGTPIEGLFVNANDGLAACCHFLTGSRTNASGDYAILVHPGTYKVLFFSRAGFLAADGVTYVDQWWNGAPSFDQGTQVVIGAADVGGINAVMTRAVLISGRVTDATGAPIAHAFVSSPDATRECCHFLNGGETDATGHYSYGVPLGSTVKVQFAPPAGSRFFGEWWNDKPSFDIATAIIAAADVPDIDASLATGFLVSGHVGEQGTGANLANVFVQVIDPAVPCCPFRQIAMTQTNASGDYSVGLAAGTYKVQFFEFPEPVHPHMQQWWQGKPFDQGADLLVVATDRPNIDALLTPAVFIRGRVTDATGTVPLAGISVSSPSATLPCCQFIQGSQTDAAGNYSYLLPLGGLVKVQFAPPPGSSFVGEWWNDKPDFMSADPLNMATDQLQIDARLATGFILTGHVSNADGTVSLAGVGVNVNDATLPCCQFIVGTGTDALGNYRVAVPAGRRVRVFFSMGSASGSRLIPQWWNGKAFFDQADVIEMTADRGGVNAQLASGVFIRGRVTDSTGTIPVAGLNLSAQDASQPCCRFVSGAQTDGGGFYTLLVPSGAGVKIEFGVFGGTPSGSRYLGEWWNDKPSFDTANELSAISDQNGVDVRLDSGFLITGIVRGPGGVPVPNVFVGASLGGPVPCCQGVGGTNTDATGHYRLTVRQGTYRLNVSASPDRRLVMQWWAGVPGGTPYFERAADITVGPADATDRDFDVVFGTLIQGRVTDTSGNPLGGIGVTANDATIPCCEGLAFGGADAAGRYTLIVPPGRLVRVFFGTGNSPFGSQWWDNKPSFDVADILETSIDHPAIDAHLASAVTIGGRVTDSTGTIPVPGAEVNALDGSVPCCVFLGGAQTDAQGNYSISLAPGRTVKIAFAIFGPGTPPGTRYLGQWWNDKQSFDAATPIVAGASVSGVDAHLATGFLISGHVNDREGHSLPGIHVQVIDPAVPCCPFREIAHTQTNATGDYAAAVPAGTYKVQFFEFPLAAEPHLNQWWQQKPFDQGADLLVVTGDRPGIDAFMDAAKFVRGRVTDETGTTGIPGVFVSASNDETQCCKFLGGAQTDSLGNYSFIVPRNTLVKVQFQPPSGSPYTGEWWNDKSAFSLADSIFMVTDQNFINARLAIGFIISGRVTEAGSGAGLEGVQVVASDRNLSCCVDVGATRTGPGGTYQLRVGPGTYRVWFGDPSDRHLPQFWRNHSGGPEQADPVIVGPDQPGVDAALIPAVTIRGHVSDVTGSIVYSGLNVSAQDATVACCRFVAGTQVDVDGNYRMLVPAGSRLKVEFGIFSPPRPHTNGQWWNNKSTFELADEIVATANLSGIDAKLNGMYTLTGRVTERGTGLPLAGIRVQPFDASNSCCLVPVGGGSVTNALGDYALVIPGGRYKLNFFESPLGEHPHYFQWWSDHATSADANVLIIFDDSPGANASLMPAVFISGQITDASDGHAIAGLQVSGQDATLACCRFVDGAQTDTSGNYRFIAPLGASIKIEFGVLGGSPPGTSYLGEWWDDKPSFDTATALLADANKTGINAQLARSAAPRVSGRVTDAANSAVGVANVGVMAQPNFGCCFYSTTTRADGRYTLDVTAGTYRISFFPPYGSDFLEQWWNNEPGYSAADLLTVPSTSVDLSSINAVLIHGIPVSGTTSDAAGAPVAQVGVVATLDDPAVPCCVNYSAQTDSAGHYTLYVRAGRYRINFQPPSTSDFVIEYWNDKPDYATATLLDVSVPTSSIDAVLERGFHITGRVTDAVGGGPVQGSVVTINPQTCCQAFTVVQTGPDGTYSVTVRPGTYKIGFNPPYGTDFVSQYWNGKPDF